MSASTTMINYGTLCDVNGRVNQMRYAESENAWQDALQGHDMRGNCTTYAVTKMDELLKLGWPRDHMWLMQCAVGKALTPNHVVLLVRYDGGYDSGYYVLSNGMGVSSLKYMTRWPYYWTDFWRENPETGELEEFTANG